MSSTLAVDLFTVTVDTDIESHNGDWTYTRGDSITDTLTVEASTDSVAGSTTQYNIAEWSGLLPSPGIEDAHYAQVTVEFGPSAGNFHGCAARCQGAGTGNAYVSVVDGITGVAYLSRIDSGVETILGSSSPPSFVGGDAMRAEVDGSDIRGFAAGFQFAAATDSTYVGGIFGIACWNPTSRVDNFQGGNLNELSLRNIGPFQDDFREIGPFQGLVPPTGDQTVLIGTIAASTAIVEPAQINQATLIGTIAASTAIVEPQVNREIDIGTISASTAILAPAQVNRELANFPLTASTAILPPLIGADQTIPIGTISANTATVAPDQVNRTTPLAAIQASTAIVAPSQVNRSVAQNTISASTAAVAPDRVNREIQIGSVAANTAVLSPGIEGQQIVVIGAISASTAIVAPDQVNREIAIGTESANSAILAPAVAAPQIIQIGAIEASTAIVAPAQINRNVVIPAPITVFGAFPPITLDGDQTVAIPFNITASTGILAPNVIMADQTVPVGVMSASTAIPTPNVILVDQIVSIGVMSASTAILAPAPDQVRPRIVGIIDTPTRQIPIDTQARRGVIKTPEALGTIST